MGEWYRRRGEVFVEATEFRAWLYAYLDAREMIDRRTGRLRKESRTTVGSLELIAKDWGTSARKLASVLYGERRYLSDGFLDQVYTAAGVPHLLLVNHPELGEADDALLGVAA